MSLKGDTANSRFVPPAKRPASGRLTVGGGKSAGIRALILSAFAEGHSTITSLPDSQDLRDAQNALQTLGLLITVKDGAYHIDGLGAQPPVKAGTMSVGNSGAAARFLTAFLSLCPEGDWTIETGGQLAKRPILPLVDALRNWGADIRLLDNPNGFPIRIFGKRLRGGMFRVSAKESSQFASALVMASPLSCGETTVAVYDAAEEEAYFGLTARMMRVFGASVEEIPHGSEKARFFHTAHGKYQGTALAIPADANTANYFFAAASLTGGSVAVANLRMEDETPGIQFLEVFRRMGCRVESSPEGITVSAMEIGARRPNNAARLKGGFTIDMRTLSESAPTLAVMACFADSPITMSGLAHIRGHETDRLSALAALLPLLGAGVEEYPDGLRIIPQGGCTPPECGIRIDPRDDHRLAMAFAVGGAACGGAEILTPSCVGKTCPDFFERLTGLMD
jgi:3-phosphoshikimate 1-carboxyvinyltransferase